MVISADIVTGVGYGDEGKGMTTNWLVNKYSNSKPLVIRYGGGNQVGHTVVKDGVLFEHHHTGSGTMSGAPTFYSRFCTVDPVNTLQELDKLKELGPYPVLIYDPKAMLVTPMDVMYNRYIEETNKHGSVGVGFGATVGRNEDHYRLSIYDIDNEEIFKSKYFEIVKYYISKGMPEESLSMTKHIYAGYYDFCRNFRNRVQVRTLKSLVKNDFKHLIFEGHQGVLLDMEYGVFPHVTRSKTTCKNAYTLLQECNLSNLVVNNYMITRVYHTRHGNGPFEEGTVKLSNNQWETNHLNTWQGEFKVAPLNEKLLVAGIKNNLLDIPDNFMTVNTLVVTCCDQVENSREIVENMFAYVEGIDYLCTNNTPEGDIKLFEQWA